MYRPSSIFTSAGVDPDEVGAACGLSDPDRLMVKVAPSWLTRRWRTPIAAMTAPWAIYVRREVLNGDRRMLARLLTHELVHVRQWADLGMLRFSWRYLKGYLAGRRQGLSHDQAYLQIPLEQEARAISGH